jgi:23S rRNA (guanosine2251-2'-O)-methyltransferase
MSRPPGRSGRAGRHRRDPGSSSVLSVTGRRAVAEAVRAGLAREVLVAEAVRSTPALRDVLDAAGAAGVPVRKVDRSDLDRLGPDHHGVAASVRSPHPLGERDLAALPFGERALAVALDGITDPHNLGACARVAEAGGAAALVTRERRAAPLTAAAVRASAGALLLLPVARVANVHRALERLRSEAAFTVVGLDERAPRSILDAEPPAGRLALVVGSEGAGMARLTRETCDEFVSVPMRGRVASLNASTALAAAMFAYALRGGRRPGGVS